MGFTLGSDGPSTLKCSGRATGSRWVHGVRVGSVGVRFQVESMERRGNYAASTVRYTTVFKFWGGGGVGGDGT